MVQTKTCINVYSDMNTWIDFCVVIGAYEDFENAKLIIEKAYDDWWELPDAQFEPLGDFIGGKLTENGINFEIYFKEEKAEE